MKKSIWLILLTTILITIALLSCDKRNITEPRLAGDDDITGRYYLFPDQDSVLFMISVPREIFVYACVIDNSGRLVKSVYNQNLQAGNWSFIWNFTDNAGQMVDEGFYAFYHRQGNYYENTEWFEYKK